jgi:hypothetical protein
MPWWVLFLVRKYGFRRSKFFFFEKKKQKTFVPLRARCRNVRTRMQKFLGSFFSRKKNCPFFRCVFKISQGSIAKTTFRFTIISRSSAQVRAEPACTSRLALGKSDSTEGRTQ